MIFPSFWIFQAFSSERGTWPRRRHDIQCEVPTSFKVNASRRLTGCASRQSRARRSICIDPLAPIAPTSYMLVGLVPLFFQILSFRTCWWPSCTTFDPYRSPATSTRFPFPFPIGFQCNRHGQLVPAPAPSFLSLFSDLPRLPPAADEPAHLPRTATAPPSWASSRCHDGRADAACVHGHAIDPS